MSPFFQLSRALGKLWGAWRVCAVGLVALGGKGRSPQPVPGSQLRSVHRGGSEVYSRRLCFEDILCFGEGSRLTVIGKRLRTGGLGPTRKRRGPDAAPLWMLGLKCVFTGEI